MTTIIRPDDMAPLVEIARGLLAAARERAPEWQPHDADWDQDTVDAADEVGATDFAMQALIMASMLSGAGVMIALAATCGTALAQIGASEDMGPIYAVFQSQFAASLFEINQSLKPQGSA